MRFLLPVLLALIGAASGVGAGFVLKPGDHQESPTVAGDGVPEKAAVSDSAHSGVSNPEQPAEAAKVKELAAIGHEAAPGTTEFTKLNNQFVVPVLRDGRVSAMVILSLSLETPPGKREAIFALEPRIRDTLLQVLFDHANAGGFDGEFTSGAKMEVLRGELRRSCKQLLGSDILNVLVTDIARQDLG